VPKRRIEIIAGHTSRTKVIKFRDISSDELCRYLSS